MKHLVFSLYLVLNFFSVCFIEKTSPSHSPRLLSHFYSSTVLVPLFKFKRQPSIALDSLIVSHCIRYIANESQ